MGLLLLSGGSVAGDDVPVSPLEVCRRNLDELLSQSGTCTYSVRITESYESNGGAATESSVLVHSLHGDRERFSLQNGIKYSTGLVAALRSEGRIWPRGVVVWNVVGWPGSVEFAEMPDEITAVVKLRRLNPWNVLQRMASRLNEPTARILSESDRIVRITNRPVELERVPNIAPSEFKRRRTFWIELECDREAALLPIRMQAYGLDEQGQPQVRGIYTVDYQPGDNGRFVPRRMVERSEQPTHERIWEFECVALTAYERVTMRTLVVPEGAVGLVNLPSDLVIRATQPDPLKSDDGTATDGSVPHAASRGMAVVVSSESAARLELGWTDEVCANLPQVSSMPGEPLGRRRAPISIPFNGIWLGAVVLTIAAMAGAWHWRRRR